MKIEVTFLKEEEKLASFPVDLLVNWNEKGIKAVTKGWNVLVRSSRNWNRGLWNLEEKELDSIDFAAASWLLGSLGSLKKCVPY